MVVDGAPRTISQANNVYIFPGVGLAAIAGRLKSIPDEAFAVAAKRLAALTAESAPAGARAEELVDGAMWSPSYRAYVPA